MMPTPAIVLMLAGLMLWRRPVVGRRLLVAGAILLLLFSVPGTAKVMAIPLLRTVPALDDGQGSVHMVVVPTAGIYEDQTGGWWAGAESIRRVTLGRLIQAKLEVPLALVGGATAAEGPPEAEVVARIAGLAGDMVILDTRATNSWQTGQAVARLLAETPRPRVALVTSALHMARMAASLRHAGIEVAAVPVGQDYLEFEGWQDAVPGYRGLDLNRRTIHEYTAMIWYLLTGQLAYSDFISSRDADGG